MEEWAGARGRAEGISIHVVMIVFITVVIVCIVASHSENKIKICKELLNIFTEALTSFYINNNELKLKIQVSKYTLQVVI